MGLFYEEELVKIYNGDAEAEMSKMDDGSVDLVVTSPPYNLKNSRGWGLKGNFHKSNNWHKDTMKVVFTMATKSTTTICLTKSTSNGNEHVSHR